MERITAALVATLLLAGCGPGDTQREREARPASEAPASEAPLTQDGSDTTPDPDGAIASDDPDGSVSNADVGDDTESPPADDGTRSPSSPSSRPSSQQPTAEPPSQASQQPTSSQQASPDAVLRATSEAYEGLRSFRATFRQTLRNTLLGRTTESEGTLYQRQPDRFLMEFTDPPNDRIVSDGRYFWMYFPSADPKQVIRSSRGAQGLDLRSQFIGDPVRRFESTYHGTEAVQGRRAHVMTLVPRESMGYDRLKVWIDANDHLVRRFELTENNGNIRHFVLSDLARNPSLPDELFEFTPPAGTQVVDR